MPTTVSRVGSATKTVCATSVRTRESGRSKAMQIAESNSDDGSFDRVQLQTNIQVIRQHRLKLGAKCDLVLGEPDVTLHLNGRVIKPLSSSNPVEISQIIISNLS